MRTLMRARAAAAIGAGALVLLSACGQPAEDQKAGSEKPPATSAPVDESPDKQPARTPPAGGTEVQDAQIDATALPPRFPKMVWTQDDGGTVGVVAQEGGCGKASLELPTQDAKQVVITMVETQPAEPKACTMDLRYPKLTVSLDEPLDDRTVVLKQERRKS